MAVPDPQRWQIVSPLLDEGLEVPESERAAWLAALRAKDAELAAEVEELLKEHRALQQEQFLERFSLPLPQPAMRAGVSVGAYRLIEPIGEGGMGVVWLAERSDGRFQRRVAVKFLSIAMGGRLESRFRREGSILGRLAHENIAELVDAGITAEGRPYLVLEYVEGESLDRYCNQRKLGVEARLHLFRDVLAAVMHAHANLVVHRDIKPSNVLVSNDGKVKLLDFGIAKLLEDAQDASQSNATLTREGAWVLTPEYAAPEQVLGGPVTTATDIYALGVLLYVLLTGQHPFGTGTLTAAELVAAATHTEPPRPSDAVVSGKVERQTVAANADARGSTPEKLRKQLRGDLDVIVGKALKKDAQERYASATEMAEDLRRHLSHEPIRSRPDTVRYRMAKFVRRNRVAVGLSAVAAIAVVAGVAGIVVQARVARAQRDFAMLQLSRAEAINDLNEYVLSDAAPSGKPFTVNELLSGATDIVEHQRSGDPADRVELLISIGHQYTVEDDYQKARTLLEQAYQLSRGLSEHSIRAQASCALGHVLSRVGMEERAEALFQEGMAELPNDPVYVPDRVNCLLRGSEIAANGGGAREVLERAEEAQRVLEQSAFHSDSLRLDALIVVASAYGDAGKGSEANAAYSQAAEQLDALGRGNTQMAATLYNNWGTDLIQAGQPLAAERVLRRSLEISRDGQADASLTPTTLSNYSVALREIGRLDEAASYAERAYARAVKSGDGIATSQALLHRAAVYRLQGNLSRAADILSQLERWLRGKLPPGHIAFGAIDSERAQIALTSGNVERALALANKAVGIAEAAARSGKQGSAMLPGYLSIRSNIEFRAGHPQQAEADASRALSLLNAPGGSACSFAGRAYIALGNALLAEGKRVQAQAALRSGVQELQETLGAGSPDTRAAQSLLAENSEKMSGR